MSHSFRPGSVSGEMDLLCCCMGIDSPAPVEQRITELVDRGVDWPRLLAMAEPHGMLPLLAWHLGRLRPVNAPAPLLQHMAEDLQRHGRENLRLAAELARILRALEQQGIEVMTFKGPAQALALYGNIGLREFSDLDLLVRPRDMDKLEQAMRWLGFRPWLELHRWQEASHRRNDCETEFLGPDDVCVDAHWALTARHYALGDIPGIWERARKLPIGGVEARVPAPEDLLLILGIHGHKHYWERLCWLCDVAVLVRKHPDMNFEAAIERASSMGARRMVLLALRLASEIPGAPLPESVQRQIASDPALEGLAGMAARRIRGAPQSGGDVARWRFVLAARDRWTDKVRCAARFLLTPTREDWLSLPLPAGLAALYPAIRVARIAGRCLRLVPARPAWARSAAPTLSR